MGRLRGEKLFVREGCGGVFQADVCESEGMGARKCVLRREGVLGCVGVGGWGSGKGGRDLYEHENPDCRGYHFETGSYGRCTPCQDGSPQTRLPSFVAVLGSASTRKTGQ